MTKYLDTLIKDVLEHSESKVWSNAVNEWEVVDVREDRNLSSMCICGKEGLRYLFRIRNSINNNTLFPIGSRCIKKFERNDLNMLVDVKEKLFVLFHALQSAEYITLDSTYFSRNLIEYLYDEGVFAPTRYNKYDGINDYEFLLDMFNQRKEPNSNQQGKINGIIAYSIIPYLQKELSERII